MQDTPSERRLAENEVVFRQLNEQIHHGYDETNKLAQEDNQPEFAIEPGDGPMHFFCECADETCGERVIINVQDYEQIHKKRNYFIVLPGHEIASIEDVVEKKPGYYIVAKHAQPPSSAGKLNPTTLRNA